MTRAAVAVVRALSHRNQELRVTDELPRNLAGAPEVSVKLISLDRLPDEAPHWPWSPWATRRLIRMGSLGAVRVGRRVFVTLELLEAFVQQHTKQSPLSKAGV